MSNDDIVRNLRTFATIATAHLLCARNSLGTCVPSHLFQARASSRNSTKYRADDLCTEAYRCHPTSDFKNPTSAIRLVKIRHPTCKNSTSEIQHVKIPTSGLFTSDIQLVKIQKRVERPKRKQRMYKCHESYKSCRLVNLILQI